MWTSTTGGRTRLRLAWSHCSLYAALHILTWRWLGWAPPLWPGYKSLFQPACCYIPLHHQEGSPFTPLITQAGLTPEYTCIWHTCGVWCGGWTPYGCFPGSSLYPWPIPSFFFSLSLLLLSLPFCVLYLILLNFFLTIYCFLTSEGTKARPQADNQLYSPDLFMRSVSLFCEILLAWILHFTSYNQPLWFRITSWYYGVLMLWVIFYDN